MFKIILYCSLFLIMVSCQKEKIVSEPENNTSVKISSVKENGTKNVVKKTAPNEDETVKKFEKSSYDRTDLKESIESHQKALGSLSEIGIFKAISDSLVKGLSYQNNQFFSSHPQYELLSVAKGALTSSAENDLFFIVFDQNKSIIKMIFYQADKNLYRELYRTIKVKNGLEKTGCNYSSFGTLDYQMGEEIIYQEEFLKKNKGQFLEAVPMISQGLQDDDNFVPDRGCFSKGMNKNQKLRFVAVPTSQVYSNWEGLTYQSASDSFLIFYGQAFAD